METHIEKAQRIFEREDRIAFAYVFGSAAKGRTGPLSDLDFAIYLNSSRGSFSYRLKLLERLSKLLKTDRIDLVILGDASPLLQFEIVKGGRVLKDEPETRIRFETVVVEMFLDTLHLRDLHRRSARRQLTQGGYFG